MNSPPFAITATAGRAALLWFVVAVLLCAAGVRAAESVTTAWARRYSHPTTSSAGASKVVTDHAGNVIVAGAANNGVTGGDFLVVKYSGAGVPWWTNRYGGPGGLDDGATAVAVDADDNVFVTGICCAWRWENGDYATIKYSGAGVPLWTNFYSGPGDSDDRPSAIAVDRSGNVFVTGYSTGDASSHDYATIGYSGAGVPLWTNRYDGPGHLSDLASAIAVDRSGNVFVTGESPGLGGASDFSTVAYSPAGVPLWTNRFGDGEPAAMAVDGRGNVFVTGAVCSTADCDVGDMATVAYSGAGVPLWTNRYGTGSLFNYPYDLAVDAGGNVFVAGFSDGDFVTIKYSGEGAQLWANGYNGPEHDYDAARALAVDSSGNVFVAGVSSSGGVTIKYSGAGATLWTREYRGASAETAAVDGGGNVFVTGSFFVTVAYSSAGELMWTNGFSEVGNRNDTPYALAVDGSGNVFVTGTSEPGTSSESMEDYATVAYSSAGVPLWTNRYNGPGNWQDFASAIAVDGSGNVFVTGSTTMRTSYSSDYATIKYSGAGIPLWTNRYSDPVKINNTAYALAVDTSGNVIVTGSSESGSFDYDCVTIKYSSAGALLWANRYNGPANGRDGALGAAVDTGGNVFVTGYSSGASSAEDYLTIKYSATGALLWINRYNGPSNKTDVARALAVDNHGNVIVTGNSVGSGVYPYRDYATIKYSGAGAPLWTNRYSGATVAALAVDSNRNVFVTGTSGEWPAVEFVTIKYSEAGVAAWTNRHEGFAKAIATDAHGSVFVTGYSFDDHDVTDSITIKYSGAGVSLWTNSFRGPGGGTFPRSKSCLAIAPDGAALVAGWSASGRIYNSGFDFATIKLVSVPVLEIRRSSAAVILSWPSSFRDFTLQQNTSPFTSAGWSNFSGNVQDDGTYRRATVNSPTGSQFYRLSKP